MRRHYDETKLYELEQSIRKHGIIQPVVVMKVDDGYILIAGARRMMASERIGLEFIPVVISALKGVDVEAIKMAENYFREDVNPIDEAVFMRGLAEENGWTQKGIASCLGVSEAYVSGRMVCLDWDTELRLAVMERRIPYSVAKEIALVVESETRKRIMNLAIKNGLSGRVAAQWRREANESPSFSPPASDGETIGHINVDMTAPSLDCQTCGKPTSVHETKYVRVCVGCLQALRQ